MSATDELRRMLDERGVKWKRKRGRKHDGTEWYDQFCVYAEAVQEYSWDGFEHPEGKLLVRRGMGYLTPEQAIATTLGTEDAYTREDVEGAFVSGYSLGLDMYDHTKVDADKGWNQNERDMDEEMAELGWVRDRGTCMEVYLLMAIDIVNGREEVLGVYATEEAAMAAIDENQFGYAFHHVRKWEVDE